jgi:hypothetical protein
LKELYKQAKNTAREFSKMAQGASDDVRDRLTKLSHHLNTEKDSWKEEGIDGEDAIDKQQEHIQGLLSAAQMSLEGIHPVDVSIMERYERFAAQVKFTCLYMFPSLVLMLNQRNFYFGSYFS